MTPAPIARRTVAALLSTLPLTALFSLMVIAVATAPAIQRAQVALGGALIAMLVLAILAIASSFLINRRGGGPATRRLGLRIVAIDGTPLTLGRALRRQVGALVVFPILMGGAGVPGIIVAGIILLAPAMWREDGRGLHDLVAGSIVIEVPADDDALASPATAAGQ